MYGPSKLSTLYHTTVVSSLALTITSLICIPVVNVSIAKALLIFSIAI